MKIKRLLQGFVLCRLKRGNFFWSIFADNITLARFADFKYPDKSVSFKCHFTFHSKRHFNSCKYCIEGKKELKHAIASMGDYEILLYSWFLLIGFLFSAKWAFTVFFFLTKSLLIAIKNILEK